MYRTRCTGFLIAFVVAVIPAAELTGRAAESRMPLGSARGKPNPESRDEATITHVLNRLTFGARPGEAYRVHAMGLATWLDQQLHPPRIDDHAAEAMLPQLDAAPDSADPKELRRFARRQVET